ANRSRLLRGSASYYAGGLRAVASWRAARYRVTVDGVEHAHTGYTVVAANSGYYGSGRLIAPDARVDDGLLDVVMIEEAPRRLFFALMNELESGAHVNRPQVRVLRGREVLIEADREVPYGTDGEVEAVLPVSARVLPGGLAGLGRRVVLGRRAGPRAPARRSCGFPCADAGGWCARHHAPAPDAGSRRPSLLCAVVALRQPGERDRAEQQPEVAQGDVVVVRDGQQIHDDAGQPARDQPAPESRCHGHDDTGQDLDHSHHVHGCLGVARHDAVDPRGEVPGPVDEQIGELVQPEQDRRHDEARPKDHVRLVAGVGELRAPHTGRVLAGGRGGHGPSFYRQRSLFIEGLWRSLVKGCGFYTGVRGRHGRSTRPRRLRHRRARRTHPPEALRLR